MVNYARAASSVRIFKSINTIKINKMDGYLFFQINMAEILAGYLIIKINIKQQIY